MNGRMKGFLLAAFGACGFLEGCSFLSDSLNRPVREYFEYNTETAAITHYEIAGGSWRLDPEGAVNVSSEGDLSVVFYLRNPQRFVFSSGGQSGNLLLDFPAAPEAAVKSEAAVSQDGSDAAVITLVCPVHFLRASDCGGDISPEIRLLHPASRVDFGTYAAARFIANSPPPPVRGAAVYHDSVDGVYVVCFNMPAAQLLADGTGIHRDICRLAVNGRWFDVSVQDGRLSFSGSQFSVPADGAVPPHLRKAAETAAEFLPEAGRAVYFTTGDAVSDGGMAYEISYADRRGLTEPSSVSAQSRRLDGVTIFGSDGAPLADGAIVPPDAGSLFATVALAPPERTPDGAGSAADALVVYEVYQ
ncbi:MAG: hypothetical protein K2H09_03995, partial [Treponemataceae bacterium]|nr:hypothetical protein [Treponemataceae bacterium]